MVSFKQYIQNEGILKALSTVGLLASLAMSTPLLSKSTYGSLYQQIASHEGVRSKPYVDSAGIPTVGIGFNLADPSNQAILKRYGITQGQLKKGLTDMQIRQLFDETLKRAKSDAMKYLPNLSQHPAQVQNAIIDMSFNLGYNRLSQFKNLRQSLMTKDYATASKHMLDSKWAKQVGRRATYLAGLVNASAPSGVK